MTSARTAMVAWLEQRLTEILRAPPMWGSDESVEFQVLQLLEMRDAAQNPFAAQRQPRRVFDRYAEYLQERFPQRRAPGHSLAQGADLANLLRQFSNILATELPEENPFETHEVAVRLTFTDRRAPSANAVSSYIDGFRRAIRAVAKEASGAGRPSKGIATATDYALEDLQLRPQNGLEAQATVCLGPGHGQADFDARDRVRDGFAQLLAVADWAGHNEPVSSLQISHSSRIALQAQRLLPGSSSGVSRVELGGKLIGRPTPVLLMPSLKPRLLEAVKTGSKEEPFDLTDEIRAIDLDSSTILLGAKRTECSVPQELLEQVTEVGVRAHVTGSLVKPVGGKAFVIVEALTQAP
jgi:hypothetical protein